MFEKEICFVEKIYLFVAVLVLSVIFAGKPWDEVGWGEHGERNKLGYFLGEKYPNLFGWERNVWDIPHRIDALSKMNVNGR